MKGRKEPETREKSLPKKELIFSFNILVFIAANTVPGKWSMSFMVMRIQPLNIQSVVWG